MIRLSPIHFFLALFVGFLFVYAVSPLPRVIIKHPNSENAGKVLYQDDNGVCYRYKKEALPCKEQFSCGKKESIFGTPFERPVLGQMDMNNSKATDSLAITPNGAEDIDRYDGYPVKNVMKWDEYQLNLTDNPIKDTGKERDVKLAMLNQKIKRMRKPMELSPLDAPKFSGDARRAIPCANQLNEDINMFDEH